MGKDTKGKGKTRAKKVKGGKRAASDSTSKLSIELISTDNAPVFRAVGIPFFFFSSSLPPDSDKEYCSQPALALT